MKVIVLRGTTRRPPPQAELTILQANALALRVIGKHFLRFTSADMWVPRNDCVRRPLLSALVLRALCWGPCALVDDRGNRLQLTIRVFIQLLFDFVQGIILRRGLLRTTAHAITSLTQEYAAPTQHRLDSSGVPVYVRSDILYGLRAGGSVGHVAGVLNNLGPVTGQPPVFMTTDRIPTVSPEIEIHINDLRHGYWDFPEMLPLVHTSMFPARAQEILGKRRPMFIYQRYSAGNFAGVKLAQAYDVPLALEYNGSEIWVARHWGPRLRHERLYQAIETLNLEAASVIVVVSQPLKDELLAQHIPAEKILVNLNGVNPTLYSPDIDGSAVRDRYHLEGKIVLGFIGTFGAWHGAEILARAFGRLLRDHPDYRQAVRLLMIGDGDRMPLVKEALREWAIEDLCVLTRLVPQEDAPSYLAAADILVSPHVPNSDGSRFFGSPTKLFEYMAMGRGIVASDLDQIGEVLEHDSTAWLVKPGDAEDLARGLKVLLDDPARRERLGKEARKAVLAHYTWEQHTRRIVGKLHERVGSLDHSKHHDH